MKKTTDDTSELLSIERYQAEKKDEWNAFVEGAKNATFLFDRNYMDYHADRFADHSLMFYRRHRLCGLLPANALSDGTLSSHQGLTYGGLIVNGEATARLVADMMRLLNDYLRGEGFAKVVYKALPWIYHDLPAEEDLHALTHVCGAWLVRRDLSSTIFINGHIRRFDESRRSGLRKAERARLQVEESTDYQGFWKVLTDNLSERFHVSPVHRLDEMLLLVSRFPSHIRLFVVRRGNDILGGTVLYLTKHVVHTQYISASAEGKKLGALDLLFHYLLNDYDFGRSFFDFGTSASDAPSGVNAPLLFQKEGFGGRGICYDTYEWML